MTARAARAYDLDSQLTDSPLNAAPRLFEAADANPINAEKVLCKFQSAIPTGVAFGGDTPEHEQNCRTFIALLAARPKRW